MSLSPLKIVLLYTLFGCIWIISSDQILYITFSNTEYLTISQSVKGWAYVIITGLLLYLLISKYSNEINHLLISEQKQKEEKEAILASTHDGIIAVKENGDIFYLNSRAKEIINYEPTASIKTTKFWELFPSPTKNILEQAFNEIKNSHINNSFYITQININCDEEKPKWIEVKINKGSPYHHPILICTLRDITETIKNYRSIELLKQALDQVGIGLAIVNTSGKILLANATLLNWANKNLTQPQNVLDILKEISPELNEKGTEIIKAFQSKENLSTIIEVKDGELRPHYYLLEVYSAEISECQYGIVILSDITNQILAEKRLLQKQRIESIGFLASGIAHDFNNVLASILANLEMLMEEYKDYPAIIENLDTIRTAVFRGREMTTQILSIGKESKGELTPVNIGKMIDEVVRLIRPKIYHNIDIKLDIEPSLPHILASPGKLLQVLLNLCINACDAMSEKGGMLFIKAEILQADDSLLARHPELIPGSYIRITVSDTGPGILPQTLEHIFEPFFTSRGKKNGTGIGLYIVRTIITSLGGGISVYSEPNKGSKFCIYIPVSTDVEKGFPIPISPITIDKFEGKGEKIILVDDEPLLSKAFARVLTKLGYETKVINNPKEALDLVEQGFISNFDLLIVDNIMPEVSGEDIITKIREKDLQLPIILTSGFITDEVVEKANRLGVAGIIEKPCSSENLGRLIQKVLTEFKKEKQI